jgi:hypothetical protein
MTPLGKFFPFTFHTIFISLIVLFLVSTTNSLSLSFYFHVFGQEDKDKEIIGFGGNNPDEKINTDSNGSISNVGEINNFNSNSGD